MFAHDTALTGAVRRSVQAQVACRYSVDVTMAMCWSRDMAGIWHRVIPGLCLESLCWNMALLYNFPGTPARHGESSEHVQRRRYDGDVMEWRRGRHVAPCHTWAVPGKPVFAHGTALIGAVRRNLQAQVGCRYSIDVTMAMLWSRRRHARHFCTVSYLGFAWKACGCTWHRSDRRYMVKFTGTSWLHVQRRRHGGDVRE